MQVKDGKRWAAKRITLPGIKFPPPLPPNLKSTLNKTPNFKQQKKRREDMQKKRNEEKQRQQAARKASDVPSQKS
jgi:hypothetical protein